MFVRTDKRNEKIPVNKIPEEELNTARKHTDEFPCIELHYCRRHSKMQYLFPELNISKMYDLYLTLWTPEDGIPTFRKRPNAVKLRYTVQTASYRARRPTVYHRYGSSAIRVVGRYTISVF